MGANKDALDKVNASIQGVADALTADAIAITDASNAIKDLAAKAGNDDVSAQLLSVSAALDATAQSTKDRAAALEAVVAAAGEPVTGGEPPAQPTS